jgi:diamine N-acetyltransferase
MDPNFYLDAARAAATSAPFSSSCPPNLLSHVQSREAACSVLEPLALASASSPDLESLALAVSLHPLLSDSEDALGRALRWACALFSALPEQLPGGWRWRVASSHPLDVAALHGCVTELAVFENGLSEVTTSPAVFLRDGFGASPHFHALLLEAPAAQCAPDSPSRLTGAASPAYTPLGMALLHATYSTWRGRTLYLEDLYLQPEARGCGAAKRAFHLLATAALAAGAQRLQWTCLEWNTAAQGLYSGPAVGAEKLEEWRLWRLERGGLQAVCRGAGSSRAGGGQPEAGGERGAEGGGK